MAGLSCQRIIKYPKQTYFFMIHIVFQYNDVDTLKAAFELDLSLQGDVIQIHDDFAVGPISGIYTEEGIATRRQWWRDVLAGGDYDGRVDNGKIPDDNATVAAVKERLSKILKRSFGSGRRRTNTTSAATTGSSAS